MTNGACYIDGPRMPEKRGIKVGTRNNCVTGEGYDEMEMASYQWGLEMGNAEHEDLLYDYCIENDTSDELMKDMIEQMKDEGEL